jgi:hypothetical protein
MIVDCYSAGAAVLFAVGAGFLKTPDTFAVLKKIN